MEKSERWMHIFFVITCFFDVALGRTTWATFWCCGAWVNVWLFERMYSKLCGELETMNGKAKG